MDSSRRIRRCPAPASAPASHSSARAPNCWNCWATRPPRGNWRKAGIPVVPGTEAPVSEPPKRPRDRAPDRLSADRQGGVRRRRARHARGGEGRRFRRQAGGGAARSRRRVRQRCGVPGALHAPRASTSKCRSWATGTATSCTCTSATARCSGGIRRWWRWRRRSALDPTIRTRAGGRRGDARARPPATTTPARSSSWWMPTPASGTSSKSTRASRWSTPSPRW